MLVVLIEKNEKTKIGAANTRMSETEFEFDKTHSGKMRILLVPQRRNLFHAQNVFLCWVGPRADDMRVISVQQKQMKR